MNVFASTLIIIVSVLLYGLTLRGVSGNPVAGDFKNNLDQATMPFELSPERGRFAHVMALAQDSTYALSPSLRDVAFPDVGVYEGKYFSFFAPGISYLSYPFYVFGEPFDLGQVTTFSFVSLMSIAAMLFLYKIAREVIKLPVWVSLMTVFTFAFASTAWSYAITLYQHHVTAFFILASFYAVWRYRQGGQLSFVWAIFVWINYALAITIDYPNAVLMLPVMIYLLLSTVQLSATTKSLSVYVRMSGIVTLLAFIALSGLHLYHNAYYLGSPTQLSGTLVGYKTILEDQLSESEDIDTLETLAEEKTVQSFFTEENVPFGFYTLTVSDDRGIFFYTPLFLLVFLGGWALFQRGIKIEDGILLTLVGVNLLLYSSWGDPWGGWAFGPRYLIPSMGIIALYTWYGIWHSGKHFMLRFLAVTLFVYSAAISLLGALTTNAVPPKIEGVYLGAKYNFLRNLEFFEQGKSGSFLYNTYFADAISLPTYYTLILVFIIVVVTLIVFVVPTFEYDHND